MRKNYLPSILLLLITTNCVFLPSNIAVKNYHIKSIDHLSKSSNGKKLRIYLTSQDKRNFENNTGKSISVSNNCNSDSSEFINSAQRKIWSAVENKAFEVARNNELPITFVCSSKEADYIFEYSFNEAANYQALTIWTLPFHIALLGVPPFVNSYQYDITLNVISPKNKTLINSDKGEFNNFTITSSLLLPFSPIIEPGSNNTLENVRTNTIAKMIVDKALEKSASFIKSDR